MTCEQVLSCREKTFGMITALWARSLAKQNWVYINFNGFIDLDLPANFSRKETAYVRMDQKH